MKYHRLEYERDSLEAILQQRVGNAQISVRARGSHLYVEIPDGAGGTDVIARATELRSNEYGVSFRSHTGRWEPMPVFGTAEVVAEEISDMLGPYLTQH